MGKRLLKLPRKLFGYRPSSVDQLIADRDSMLGVAEQRVRSAEARIAELEEELSRRQEDLEAVKSQREPEHAPAEAPKAEAPPADPLPPLPAIEGEHVEPADKADDADEIDDIDDIEEWPLPTIQPRTVEFNPPPEPSADFDPMPIGGEDRDWSTPSAEAWGPADAGPAAVEEAEPWGATGQEPSAVEEAPAWGVAREDLSAEPAIPAWEVADQGPDTPVQMSEELATAVKAAEASATKIIEQAWEATRMQIAQVDGLWREVQAEIVRFAQWRQHVDPLVSTVQGYIDEARTRIEEVPPRIQEALSPAIEAMARVDEGMGEFTKASDLPELLSRLHTDVAKAIDTGDFTASTSEAGPGDAGDPGSEAPAELTSPDPGANDRAHTNGGPREGDDLEMARAIAHELRIINESGETVPASETA